MTMWRPDWQTLNAYVDGELDPRGAADVAKAAGEDMAVAEQIACLYQLKGVTAAAAPETPDDLAVLLPPASSRWRPVIGAMAAVAVLAALVAVVAVFGPSTRLKPPTLSVATLEQARGLHDAWLASEHADRTEAAPAVVLAALSQFEQVPVIPDLKSAQLYIERVAVEDRAGGHLLQIGYRGNHGCHLSLFVFARGDLPDQLVRRDNGPERAYGWQVDGLGYLLLAVGMDRGRFELIAEKVEAATHTRTPFDTPTRQALADSKAHSASCAA